MKKILISLLCCILFATITVSAQIDKPTIDSETKIVSLSGTSTVQNGKVTVLITSPKLVSANVGGATVEVVTPTLINEVTVANIKSKTSVIYELRTNEHGEWNGQFTLPATALPGKYMVYVSGEAETYFYYANETEINEALSAVKNASETTLGNVLYKYTIEKEILALDLSGDYSFYTAIENADVNIHKSMIGYVNAYNNLSISDVTIAFEKAIELARYAYGNKDAVKKAMTDNHIGFTSTVQNSDAVIDMYISLRTQTFDESILQKELRSAEALVKINSATKGEMTQILEDYNDVLELQLDGNYAKVDKINVNKGLTNKNFTNVTDLRNAFSQSLQAVMDENDGTQSGSGGGNGGGGGGGKVTSKIEVEHSKPDSEEGNANGNVIFNDIDSALWASEYINVLAEKNIINGVGNNRFAPLENVSREAFLKMLINAFGVSCSSGKTDFSDVKSGSWYEPYVTWAVNNNIVNGIDSLNFGIGKAITREQMTVMTVRMFEKFGYTLNSEKLSFSDKETISSYAKEAVGKVFSEGIIQGMPDGSFKPQDNLNRAQAAKVIYMVLSKVGGLNE